MNQPEKMIENQILHWLKVHSVFSFKIKSTGTFDPKTRRFRATSPWYKKGCPDILVCLKGQFIGIEVKTKNGRLNPNQKQFHEEARAHGAKIFVVRDVSELDEIFKTLGVPA